MITFICYIQSLAIDGRIRTWHFPIISQLVAGVKNHAGKVEACDGKYIKAGLLGTIKRWDPVDGL